MTAVSAGASSIAATPRTAVVTGAAGALGRAAGQALLAQGRRVLMVDVAQAALRPAAADLPREQVAVLAADVTGDDIGLQIEDAIRARDWPAATILVNNAGISPRPNGVAASVLEMTGELWSRVLAVNVTAPMFLCKHLIPGMQAARWGRIVNVASAAGRFRPVNAGPAYATSKAALLGLTRSLASAYGRDGITCNAVAPGLVPSGLTQQLSPQLLQRAEAVIALGRVGEPAEVGAAVAFLASEGAGYITGACLDVNGGAHMI